MIEILKWALALVLTSCVATFVFAALVHFFDSEDWERSWTIAITIVFWCWVFGGIIAGLYLLWAWVGAV